MYIVIKYQCPHCKAEVGDETWPCPLDSGRCSTKECERAAPNTGRGWLCRTKDCPYNPADEKRFQKWLLEARNAMGENVKTNGEEEEEEEGRGWKRELLP